MIKRWSELDPGTQAEVLPQFRHIFFESSSIQDFVTDEAKRNFWERWTGYYFAYEIEQIYLYFAGKHLAGYLTGCLDSLRALRMEEDKNPSLKQFEDMLVQFPAHLHMNFHRNFRGKGYGTQLVQAFLAQTDLLKMNVHIITAPDMPNVLFYEKNGFTQKLLRQWRGYDLLFMGRAFKA